MKKFFSVIKHIFFSIFLLFSADFALWGENFRVRQVIPLSITTAQTEQKIISGINDAVFITVPEDLTYISALQLTLKIPEEIATWRDSVAYEFYDRLTPSPSAKNIDYYGDRIFIKTLPSKLSLTLTIPISQDFSTKESPYSEIISPVPDYKKGIFLRFQLVMKGVPESLESSEIEITAKPVLKNIGNLSLSVTPSVTSEKNYTVYIDDSPVQSYKNLLLKTGEHRLSIVSDSYRNEVRTFIIEQAKKTELSVQLRGNEPTLRIISPAAAAVFLDGNRVTALNDTMIITPGDHLIKFTLGDYEAVKNITVSTGRAYTVSLDISASVSEED